MNTQGPINAADALCRCWRDVEIKISLPGMGAFAYSPSLTNKLRGALGEALLESASPRVWERQSCNWSRPSTADMFFGPSPTIVFDGASCTQARPYVLYANAGRAGALDIQMRIFGAAAARAESVCDALLSAIRRGVDWRAMTGDGPRFLPGQIHPSDVRVREQVGLPIPSLPAEGMTLSFLSPIDAERGDPARNPALILDRLVRRVGLVAPWFGLSLAEEAGCLSELAKEIELEIEDIDSASAIPSMRGGHHHANELCPPLRLKLGRIPEAFWPILIVGERTHVGRGANIGLGRYRLVY